MLNDAETRGEYPDNDLSHMPRIKWLKNMGLKERNSFIMRLEHFLVQSSVSKCNDKDMHMLDNLRAY